MTCDEALQLLNARIDGEVSAADLSRLESHLKECADCRVEAAALEAQNAALRKAFAGHRLSAQRVGDKVIAQLPRRTITRWLPMIASAAAGFVVAWAIFRVPKESPRHVAVQPSAAHLTLATGAVEAADSSGKNWSALPTGAAIDPGTRLRTGAGVRCELLNADGSQLRLNEKSEIVLASPRRFELVDGQAWSTVAHDPSHPFQALAAAVTFTALGTQFDLRTSSANHDAMLTVVEGTVRADAGSNSATVLHGQQLTCPDGHLGHAEPAGNLVLATRWVNELLVLKGRDDPELSRRIDDLFAQIGATKMSGLYEDEIRALGDHCVIPLTRYIESKRSANDALKRVTAAQIVSDVAPPWAIPELLPLLRDDDGQVRAAAATALRRLTGESMNRSPEQWRQESMFQCAPSANAWEIWWKENKALFPGAAKAPKSE